MSEWIKEENQKTGVLSFSWSRRLLFAQVNEGVRETSHEAEEQRMSELIESKKERERERGGEREM